MKVALGMKAHSGWAALVAIGDRGGEFTVLDRRRIELVDGFWAKQPYHAAKTMKPGAAREAVARATETARRLAAKAIQAAVARERGRQNDVTSCAVLVATPMPGWTLEEILAVHVRMHKAEGVLFPDALAHGVERSGLRMVAITEKALSARGARALGQSPNRIDTALTTLGKPVGPPWGKDQKQAALAAMIALRGGDG
jgi:hypothetical protein